MLGQRELRSIAVHCVFYKASCLTIMRFFYLFIYYEKCIQTMNTAISRMEI